MEYLLNSHVENQQIQEDESRDKYLDFLGFFIIRLKNRIVFQHPAF
ncbi:MAG TPA: hypothetical protein PLY36_16410 [Spirochaetota bacterium]|nr:hypothetical protein [Spirochaetota bacterium]